MVTPHPFGKQERAVADRHRRGRRILQYIGIAKHVGRQNGGILLASEREEEGPERLRQMDDDGLRIGRLDVLDRLAGGAELRTEFRAHLEEGEFYVLGGNGLAVAEARFLEMERIGQPVRRDLPGFGEAGLDLETLPEAHEGVVKDAPGEDV